MKEVSGEISCRHLWIYDRWIACTTPPKGHRICADCGRVEHIYEKPDTFNETMFKQYWNKFHGGV